MPKRKGTPHKSPTNKKPSLLPPIQEALPEFYANQPINTPNTYVSILVQLRHLARRMLHNQNSDRCIRLELAQQGLKLLTDISDPVIFNNLYNRELAFLTRQPPSQLKR